MIIELVGLPGAGKSTFARALASGDQFTRIRIKTANELLWYNLIFLLRHPISFLRLFTLFIRYRGPRSLWYTKFTSVFLDYNAKYMKARKVPYAILDQGHLQVLLSMFEVSLSEAEFSAVFKILPKSDQYVVFALDEAERLAQLNNRGYESRAGLMDDTLRRQWRETAVRHFGRMLESALPSLKVPVHVVRNCSEIDELLTRLAVLDA